MPAAIGCATFAQQDGVNDQIFVLDVVTVDRRDCPIDKRHRRACSWDLDAGFLYRDETGVPNGCVHSVVMAPPSCCPAGIRLGVWWPDSSCSHDRFGSISTWPATMPKPFSMKVLRRRVRHRLRHRTGIGTESVLLYVISSCPKLRHALRNHHGLKIELELAPGSVPSSYARRGIR